MNGFFPADTAFELPRVAIQSSHGDFAHRTRNFRVQSEPLVRNPHSVFDDAFFSMPTIPSSESDFLIAQWAIDGIGIVFQFPIADFFDDFPTQSDDKNANNHCHREQDEDPTINANFIPVQWRRRNCDVFFLLVRHGDDDPCVTKA